MLTDRQPFQLVEQNLRHALAFYAGSHSKAEVRQMPGVAAISCGWNYPVFNSALLTSAVPGEGGGIESRLAMASVYFRALDLGWSFWACHDMLDDGCLNVFGISARHHVVGLFGFQRLSDGAFHWLQGGMGTGRQLCPELGTGCR